MSEKLWHKRHDWVQSAPCGGDIRFIQSPRALGPKDESEVRDICGRCLVRPECIRENLKPVTLPDGKRQDPANSVWVAGEWLPSPDSPPGRRELEMRTGLLLASLPGEFERRDETKL